MDAEENKEIDENKSPSSEDAKDDVPRDKKENFEMEIETDNSYPRETFKNDYELYASLISNCLSITFFTLIGNIDFHENIGKFELKFC